MHRTGYAAVISMIKAAIDLTRAIGRGRCAQDQVERRDRAHLQPVPEKNYEEQANAQR